MARDFGLQTKDIMEILAKYATAPKNHMQVLEDQELSIIFDYLTQHHAVSGIQEIFADTYKEEQKKSVPPVQATAAPIRQAPTAHHPEGAPRQENAPQAARPAQQNPSQQGTAPARPAPQQQNAPAGGMATGVLPVFVGHATRAVEFAENSRKEYVAGVRFGLISDTQDVTGTVLETRPASISRAELEAILPRFTGQLSQIPPMI